MENIPNSCRFFGPLYSFFAFVCIIIVYCETRFDLLFSVIMNWVLNIHMCMTV